MATSLCCSKVRMSAVSRRTVTVRASSEAVSRRAAFGLFAGVAGSLLLSQQANAVTIPSQNFTGGLIRGGGSVPKSSSKASMEGYSLETGIKKSGVSVSKRKEILGNLKKKATEAAS